MGKTLRKTYGVDHLTTTEEVESNIETELHNVASVNETVHSRTSRTSLERTEFNGHYGQRDNTERTVENCRAVICVTQCAELGWGHPTPPSYVQTLPACPWISDGTNMGATRVQYGNVFYAVFMGNAGREATSNHRPHIAIYSHPLLFVDNSTIVIDSTSNSVSVLSCARMFNL